MNKLANFMQRLAVELQEEDEEIEVWEVTADDYYKDTSMTDDGKHIISSQSINNISNIFLGFIKRNPFDLVPEGKAEAIADLVHEIFDVIFGKDNWILES